MGKSLVEMASDIVQAQSATRSMTITEITGCLESTFSTLQKLQSCESSDAPVAAGEEAATAATAPQIDPASSIKKDKIICLECGQSFKMLSPKHLKMHELDGRSYRKKYGFKLGQPLCAKSLSDNRKKAGKARGIPANLRKHLDAQAKKKK